MMIKSNIQVKTEPIDLPPVPILPTPRQELRFSHFSTNKPEDQSICAWCQKFDVRSFTFQTISGESKSLCSEICFDQYRRASFKKKKMVETSNDDENQKKVKN